MSLDPTDRIRHLAREWYAGERAWGEVQETFWELLTLQNAHEVLAASPWSLHDVIGGHASPFVWEVSTLRSGASFTLLKETETQPDIWDVRARNACIAMIAAGEYPTPATRMEWATTLGYVALLTRADLSEHGARIAEGLASPDARTRRWAWLCAIRVAEMGAGEGLRDSIVRCAAHEEAELLPLAVWALAEVHAPARELGPRLSRCLDGARKGVVLDALALIRHIGPAASVDSTRLVSHLEHPDEEIRLATITVLAAYPEHRATIVDVATGASIEAHVARGALCSVATELDESIVDRFLALVSESLVSDLLGAMGARARRAAPALASAAESSASSAVALGKVGGPVAHAEIERLIVAGNARHGRYALEALEDPLGLVERLLSSNLSEDRLGSVLEAIPRLRANASSLAASVSTLVRPERLWAIAAALSLPIDDAALTHTLGAFVEYCRFEPVYSSRAFHHAARAVAVGAARRLRDPSAMIAARAIEALGWSREYGDEHVPALVKVAREGGVLARHAQVAIDRLRDRPPTFRPNS